MMSMSVPAALGRVAAFACAVALGGCSAGDVELNGKVFDYIGVGSNSAKGEEVKVSERAPLVVPPGLERLPEPGSAPKRSTTVIAGVTDHDEGKSASKADLQRQQAEYCAKHYEPAKAQQDDTAASIKGPLGQCQASILTALPKMLDGESGTGEEDE